MRLNSKNQRFKAFLAGTATLLTLLATTATAAKADTTATSTAASTVDATATSGHSATPAKQVTLQSSSSSSNASAKSESSNTNSESSSTVSSASQSSSATSSSSTSSDTTAEANSSSSSSAPKDSKNDPVKVQTAAKSDNAETSKQQTVTQQYSPVTTSQKGSTDVLPKSFLMRLSYSNFAALATQAKLVVKGMSASDAVVTDSEGNKYSATDVLSLYSNYIATYHWSIDDGVPVKAGDQATLTLPKNIVFTAGTTAVQVTNAAGQSIGTFSADVGTQTGTLTFNDYFELNNVSSRQGTLTFHVNGTSTTAGDSTAKINKIGWWLSGGKSIEWQVVANLGSEAWNNATVIDQLGQYQTHNSEITFESGSYVKGVFVKAQRLGTYDFKTGVFTPEEGVSATAVTVVMDGNQMTIKLGNITTAINIFYSVEVEPDKAYTNSARVTYSLPGTTDPGTGGTTTPGNGDGDGDHSGTTPDYSYDANQSLIPGANGTASWATYTLFVTKTDKETGKVVPNAIYELQDATGVLLKSNLKTDENGQLTIPNLAAGTYVLVETAAPAGYLLDSTPHEIVIDPTAATVDGVNTYRVAEPVTDVAIPTTTLTVKKVWQNTPAGKTPDVTVKLVLNGQPTTQTLTLTSQNGYQGSFDALPTLTADGTTNNYTVVETPVTGYESSQTTVGNTVTLTNTYRTITVTKTDETGNKLANASFTLTDANGNVIGTQTTDATGQVVFGGLAQGSYYLQETQAPKGYTLNSERYNLVLDSQTNNQSVTVKDAEIKGSLTVTKVDAETKAPLANAKFELRDATNQVVQTGVTDANGQLSFNELALGTYQLIEVTAPTGYQLNTEAQQVVISDDAANQTVTVADMAVPVVVPKGQLTITKVDSATGATLAGATFDLKDTTGKVVATGVTDAQGQLSFADLTLGSYTLVETAAPNGYQLATQVQTVVLSAANTTVALTVANTAMPTTPVEPEKPTIPQVPETPVKPTAPVQSTEPDQLMPSTTTAVNSATAVVAGTTVQVTPLVANTVAMSQAPAPKKAQTLPQTDESKSVWLMIIGWLMFLLVGWFGVKRVRA